jgi:lactoylglutathione lyase
MSERPFRVLGVQQVAVGGASRDALRGLWCDLLGLPKRGEFESASENVREDIVFAGTPPFDVEIDLMEPFDPAARPRVDQPALHHIGLWIDDLAAAHAFLSNAGLRFTPGGIRRGAAGFDVCFVHPKASPDAPKSGEGVLIELVQAPPEVIAAFDKLAGR